MADKKLVASVEQIESRMSEGNGIAMVHATKGGMEQRKFPLPPLEVQQEIVAEIEGYQKVIDGARAVLDNYRPHIPIPIHPDWPVEPLSALFATKSGTTPSRSRTDYFQDGTIPWVKTLDLRDGPIRSTDEKITPQALEDSQHPPCWNRSRSDVWGLQSNCTNGRSRNRSNAQPSDDCASSNAESQSILSERDSCSGKGLLEDGREQYAEGSKHYEDRCSELQAAPSTARHAASHRCRGRGRGRAGAGRRQPRTDRAFREKNPGHPRPRLGRREGEVMGQLTG